MASVPPAESAVGRGRTMNKTESPDRKRDSAEVFTPKPVVDAMLDLFPDDQLTDPHSKVLDPACGDGNFCVAVLERKLAALPDNHTAFQALICLSSIYGIEIRPDNVEAAINRQIAVFMRFAEKWTLTQRKIAVRQPAEAIARANIVCGDTLNPDFIMTEWKPYLKGQFTKIEYAASSILSQKPDLFTATPVVISKSQPMHWETIT